MSLNNYEQIRLNEKKKELSERLKALEKTLTLLREEKAISYKESSVITNYVYQTEDSKKKVKYEKVEKILEKIGEKTKNMTKTLHTFYLDELYDLLYAHNSRLNTSGYKTFIKSLLREIDLTKESIYHLEHKEKDDEKGKIDKREEVQRRKDSKYSHRYVYSSNVEQSPKLAEVQKETMVKREERDGESPQKVEEQLKREAQIYKEALKAEDGSAFKKDNKYSDIEQKRMKYMTDTLKTEIKLEDLKNMKIGDLDLWEFKRMFEISEQITDLMEQNLLGTYTQSDMKNLMYTKTISKYDPNKLLNEYDKIYKKFSKKFDKLNGEEKQKILELFEKKEVTFIPSKDDILKELNERMKHKILECKYGIEDGQRGIVIGLTQYMSKEQIATIYNSLHRHVEEFYNSVYTKDENQQESKRIREIKTLQENFVAAIVPKLGAQRLKRTEICEQILKDDPLFEEPEISPKDIASLDKETGLTTYEVKDNIFKRILDKIKYRANQSQEKKEER